MATAYLIDIDALKKKGYVQGNVENSIIVTSLTRVQDTMLKPIIGTPFFKRLIEGVDADDLNADEETLLNDYIAPVLISGVDYKIVPHLKRKKYDLNWDELFEYSEESPSGLLWKISAGVS